MKTTSHASAIRTAAHVRSSGASIIAHHHTAVASSTPADSA